MLRNEVECIVQDLSLTRVRFPDFSLGWSGVGGPFFMTSAIITSVVYSAGQYWATLFIKESDNIFINWAIWHGCLASRRQEPNIESNRCSRQTHSRDSGDMEKVPIMIMIPVHVFRSKNHEVTK